MLDRRARSLCSEYDREDYLLLAGCQYRSSLALNFYDFKDSELLFFLQSVMKSIVLYCDFRKFLQNSASMTEKLKQKLAESEAKNERLVEIIAQ